MPPKFRATKRPKGKFSGNQFTKPSKDSQSDEPKEEAHGWNTLGEHTKKSVSSKKLLPNPEFPESKLFKDEEPPQEEATITGFRFGMEWSGSGYPRKFLLEERCYVPVNSKTAHPLPGNSRETPRHLTRVKLRTVGNLTQNEARPVGHLTFVSKRLSAVGSKRISQVFDSAGEPR